MRIQTFPALALPGALTVYFAFNAGGFFVGSQATVAVLVLIAMAVRVTAAQDPFEGISRPVAIGAAALSLYAVWALISSAWSDAPSRALLEFDRALLYLCVFVFMGSLVGGADRLRWVLRLTALAIVVVCGVGLITRLLPDVWSVSSVVANERLSYPVTYWNALGLLATLGIVFCLHLTSSCRERDAIKVAAAAAIPALAATLLFTFSRGAIVAGLAGVVVYAAIARPRGLLSAFLAVIPPSGFAVAAAYGADLLATQHPTTAAAAAQGHRVAIVLVFCIATAALLRGLLLRFEPIEVPIPRLSPRVRLGGLSAALALALALVVVSNAPSAIGHQYDRFVSQEAVKEDGDFRQRLVDPSNNNRLELWKAGFDAFEANSLTGQGAGTFQTLWTQKRPDPSSAVDGHSLYIETLAELGGVGLLLLLAVILTLLVAVGRRCRGPDRSIYAAVLAAAMAWALHAGVDWDWELPVVTLWLFAVGGAALAASRPGERLIRRPPPRFPRVLIGLAALLIAVTPARIAISQARLNESVAQFKRGDCARAIDSALSSSAAVGVRPEPYEVMGFCDLRLGLHRLAIRAMHSAVERDPENWEFHYGLAIARGAAGLDPRAAAHAALRLNPRGPLAHDLVRRFRRDDPAGWRKLAARAPLPGGLNP